MANTYYKQNHLKKLRAFCQTAKLGSMTRAAESLFASQPTISPVDVTFRRLAVDQRPQLFRAAARQRIFGLQRAAQAHHVGGAVTPGNVLPARILMPLLLEGGDLLVSRHLVSSRVVAGYDSR